MILCADHRDWAHQGRPSADEVVRAAAADLRHAWLRPLIMVLVAPILYYFISMPAAVVWIAAMLVIEGVGIHFRRKVVAGDQRYEWPLTINTVAASLCWVSHSILVWSAGGLIASIGAVLGILTVSLFATSGSYRSLRLLLATLLPQLMAMAALLISYLVVNTTPVVAFTASLGTLGACGAILISGVVMYSADATMHRTNQELAELATSAAAASRAKSEFLATMSHEIRTPLNGVLGMVQVMAREELSPEQRERLKLIGESGETLLTILSDVLDLSKIEAGKLELEEADFDLSGLVAGARNTFSSIAETKGLEFRLAVDPAAEGTYLGDATRIRQILHNLVSNAVKFTARGSLDVRIQRSASGVRFTVSDTGIGMDRTQIERLFDKFVQADSSTTRRFGGSGLGLSICRELCTAMGGTIQVESELGVGSRFTVDLPLIRLADAVSPTIASPAPAAAIVDADALRILAAEDNPLNQLVLKALLGQAGVDLTVVDQGEQAVAAWEEGDWDLILMDIQMPVMDGMTATRHIRRREAETRRAPIPIIALTANAMDHQVAAYSAAGMTAFVAKPIELEALFAAITDALNPSEPVSSAVA